MGQRFAPSQVTRRACAAVLTIVLATSAPLDAGLAYASETSAEKETAATDQQVDATANVADDPDQTATSAPAESADTGEVSRLTQEVPIGKSSNALASDDAGDLSSTNQSTTTGSGAKTDQATAQVPLASESPKPVAGEVREGGLVYVVNPDGASVTLSGWHGTAPTGDVSVPASVSSGEDSFAVTCVGVPGADGKAAGVLAGSFATSLALPSTVEDITDGALADCPSLQRVLVSSGNERFASFDGMLFTKDLTSLLAVPEGKEGACYLPDQTVSVPASALSHSPRLLAVEVGEGSVAFASKNGILYSLDMKTLVACPPGAAGAIVVPEGVEVIAPGAFAGCEVSSITALGDVREIAADAFDDAAKTAVVALPAGDDYDVRKAVWEAAGFSEFAEPAKPGDATAPKPEGEGAEGEGAEGGSAEGSEGQPGVEISGLSYTLLDDYTLSVAWTGLEDPAADLVIPATAELGGVSYRVSTIAPSAFEGRASLRSVKLPASVTTVGDAAFADCANLAAVQLPEGLRSIGASAFEATALADVWLPASVASVGPRALAACGSLQRVVALGSPEVATDALAECSGVIVYFPAEAAGSWNVGLPAAGNHLAPYGIALAETPLNLEVGQSTSVFDNGDLQAPEGIETVYAYSAKPISVDENGLITAKAEGTSDVSVVLTLDDKELARATRTVEVAPAPEPEPEPSPEAPAADGVSAPAPENGSTNQTTPTAIDSDDESATVAFEKRRAVQLSYATFLETPATAAAQSVLSTSETLASGALPTKNDVSNTDLAKAGWKIDQNGTLTIAGTETIANLGLTYKTDTTKYWLSWRDSVKKVVIEPNVTIDTSMQAWFFNMTNLVDISETRVPEGVESTYDLFSNCKSLEEIPASFTLPSTLKNARCMFSVCISLDRIAPEFKLPSGITNCSGMFQYCYKLTEVPDGFTIPSSVTDLNSLFIETGLITIPKGFLSSFLNREPINLDFLFYHCESLSSLPDDFTIPASCTSMISTFGGCLSLKALPKEFSIPSSLTTDLLASAFALSTPAELSYLGDDPVLLGLGSEWWTAQNRTLVTPSSGAVLFKTNATGIWEECAVLNPDASGLVSYVEPIPVAGQVFTLWYADADCTRRYDFSKPLDGQVVQSDGTYVLYGKYATGNLGGPVPVVADTGAAFWSLSADGVLYLRGPGTIAEFGWGGHKYDGAAPSTGVWSPYRSQVSKVSMQPGLSAVSCDQWFSRMANLVDVSEAVAPNGVQSMGWMFQGTAIEFLPDSFAVPDDVTLTWGMLRNCANLKELPSSFRLPSNLLDANGMFMGCTSLAQLPEGFTVPDNAQNLRWMFHNCTSLTSLPAGFAPASVELLDLCGMFENCTSLTALPDGFSIPSTVIDGGQAAKGGYSGMDRMFKGCTALTSLPASFSFPVQKALASYAPFDCTIEAGQPRVATFYPGNDPSVLGYDWAADNRTLLTDVEGAADRGMQRVTFQVQSVDEAAGFPWERRSTVFTDERGILANPGEPQLDGYLFSGWCSDEACLQPFDFSQPLTGEETVYGRWLVAGGRDAALPLAVGSPEGSYVWWRVTADGELSVNGAGTVAPLGFDADAALEQAVYWAPHRAVVKRVAMASGVKAQDMAAWFCRMSLLEDASKTFVPEGATSVDSLFAGCANLRELPSDFSLPGSVTSADHLFSGCAQLASLPDVLQLPSGLSQAEGLFEGCASLQLLPRGFTLPQGVSSIRSLFDGCSSLRALPEGFSVPSSVSGTGMERVFAGCDQLTYLPASFDFPLAAANASADPFLCSTQTRTYYAGTSKNVTGYAKWGDNYRELVTAVPADACKVTLMVPRDGAFEEWAVLLVDKGAAMAEPIGPQIHGLEFIKWCTDQGCATAFDFTGAVNADAVLYAQCLENLLPTTAPDGTAGKDASWSYDASTHVLTIRCDVAGVKIDKLFSPVPGNDHASPTTGFWSPIRKEIQHVVMEPGILVDDMAYWFSGMKGVSDISGVYVPDGTLSLDHTFNNCFALNAIPSAFSIADTVVNMNGTFKNCSFETLPAGFRLPESLQYASIAFGENYKLTSLPEGFSLPASTKEANYLFWNCRELSTLPSTFLLPPNLRNASHMFGRCPLLATLPAGFTIPGSVTDVEYMFTECTSLSALPEGFAFEDPSKLKYVAKMFAGCSSLTALPASLDLGGIAARTDLAGEMGAMFGGLTGYSEASPLPTYYDGEDLTKLALTPDAMDAAAVSATWKSSFSRQLYAKGEEVPSRKLVRFVTSAGSGWEPYQTVLTDESGIAADPGDPARFGYTFEGWFADEQCTQPFDFGTAATLPETTVYGKSTLVVSYDIPLKAKVAVDASGTVTPAAVEIVSRTPVPLKVTGVGCSWAGAASDAMDAATLDGLLVTLAIPGDRNPLRVSEGQSASSAKFVIPAAYSLADPGVLAYGVGFELPQDAVVRFWKDGWTTDVAKLSYTVEPVL